MRPQFVPGLVSSASVASTCILLASSLAGAGCPNVETPDNPDNEQEVITTVALTLVPEGGGAALDVSHADPENDGDPVVEPVTLSLGSTYALSIRFLNELEDPAEDITEEVEGEGEEHLVILSGGAVEGPATGPNAGRLITHAYADEDANGLPVGLQNTVVAVAAGSGELKVMLRHLPPENDTAVKSQTTAADFAVGGSAGIPGEADANVTFPLTVQ